MSAEPAHWGVPEFPSTVTRQGLLRLMENSPEEILVLAAPSGHGKTVVASQYARRLNRPVLWIAASGQTLTNAGIAQSLVESIELMLAQNGSPKSGFAQSEDLVAQARTKLAMLAHSGVVLVLDDISSPKNGDAVSTAGELLMLFRPLISRVVLTTRQSPRAFDARLPTPAIFGQRELAFSLAEANLMASHYGLGADELTSVDEIYARSGGHAALLRLMLTQEQSQVSEGDYGAPALAAQVLVEQLIDAHLSESERRVIEAVSLLKAGDASDLEALGLDSPTTHLRSIAASLPLVRLDVQDPGKRLLFEAHDLLADCVLESMKRKGPRFLQRNPNQVLGILAMRSRWSQAARVLSLIGDDATTLDFIEKHGGDMMDEQRAGDLLELINEASLRSVMSRPRCLFLWAHALHEVGEVRESVAKSAASIRLAQHERDYDTLGLAVSQRIQAWLDQGRAEESVDSAEEVIGEPLRRMSPTVRFEVLTSYGTALGVLERRDESKRAFDQAEIAALADRNRSESLLNCLRRVKAYLNPLWTGDYATGVRELSPLLSDKSASFLIRRSMRGNLAWMLMETGRLNRAEALLQSVFSPGHDILEASYLPVYGLILGARGEYGLALDTIGRSQAAAASYDDEADLHVNRLYQASVERAAGMTEHSLDSAERSFEGLSERDFIGQLRLATAEVGASLLALGDASGARAWIGDDLAVWPAPNAYHALCGAMVLAVIEHREGDTAAAVDLLAPFASYIRSESANWRMAMYCRTFPELLGLLGMAVGVDNLPIHMLRMLLPENAERGLRESQAVLSDEVWQALGRRALGEDQFNEYLERKGRPICRVRLFGGLEVNVDDRTVCERDWTKRKARLLFAMLVVRRGQDVPRDQVLEHLWPELDDAKARNNFYVIWSTMKSALMGPDAKGADCPYVESKRGRCRIVREAVRSDVDEFEELVAAARHAESSGDTEGAKTALSELMNVYRGDLLPGDVYDDWFAPLRDKYRLLFVDAMLKGVDLLLEQDNPCEAVLFARQGLNAEPHREDLYQAALKCYITAGQRSSAIEAFIQCKAQLAENLGLDPSAETLELYQQVLAMEERPRRDSYGLNPE